MSEIVIYEDGDLSIEIPLKDETIWLSTEQIASIFDVNRPAIVKHIGNIYKSEELDKDSTCSILEQVAKDGKRRKINFYNLDVIIATGYRVNSKKATAFRRWATEVLKKHLIEGYTLNQKRLQQTGMEAFKKAVALLQTTIDQEQLGCDEAKGLLDVIISYGRSWSLLEGYDENSLTIPRHRTDELFVLGYSEAKEAIEALKTELMRKKEASALFGREKAGEFDGIIGNIYQTFGGDDLIETVEEKAAHLLYYIVKDHPFNDGNKRIGAFLFILFLQKNGVLYRKNSEAKINDNALVALTLMIAKSLPEQKDTVIALVVNMLAEG